VTADALIGQLAMIEVRLVVLLADLRFSHNSQDGSLSLWL
jgi:hypothetical protein